MDNDYILTVGKLRALLADLPDDMVVVHVGHFGVPHVFETYDIGVRSMLSLLTNQPGLVFRGIPEVEKYNVLTISPPTSEIARTK